MYLTFDSDQFQVSGGLRYDNVSFDANDFIALFVRPEQLHRERQDGSGGFDDVSF
ncbi:MAG: hypothetical protein AAGF93_17390 [Cyanobacteria bacterium P01_H01_bin.105]